MAPKSDSLAATREKLRLVIVGHVDHGKSTLVGRLFHDTNSLPEGKFDAIKAMCEKRGMPFEWAFLMDALQAERDQGVTIDTSQIWFKTDARDYVLIDAPGHKEFLKNMVTGAAQSDAALLVVDAREGMQEQSRRHGYLLHLLGIDQVSVIVNKMDAVDYSESVFRDVEAAARVYLGGLGISPQLVIPVSAREGANVANRSDAMTWHSGPTVLEALDAFPPRRQRRDLPLRLPVQDVYKFDDRRIVAGRIEAGELQVGDRLLFSPSNKAAHVKSIESWPVDTAAKSVSAGCSVGITLDEQLFVERGELISHGDKAPVESDVFRARIFWLAHEPLEVGARLKMKLNTIECPVRVQAIENIISTEDLSSHDGDAVVRNAVAEVILRSSRIVPLDNFSAVPATGRFVLVQDYEIVGGGIISMEGYADQRGLITMQSTNVRRVEHRISGAAREERNGHKGAVFWFTGLSGAGKSTLALEVERRLFAKGYQTYVLDGDNIRHGLNANLGFSPEDRAENIRRVGEVAALFCRAGMVAITAFISPYRSDRERARRAAGAQFHEIYIKADVATCESRDPKGLYKRARAGEIAEFTGVSAPYETPESPELTVDTAEQSIEECVTQIVDYVDRFLKPKSTGR